MLKKETPQGKHIPPEDKTPERVKAVWNTRHGFTFLNRILVNISEENLHVAGWVRTSQYLINVLLAYCATYSLVAGSNNPAPSTKFSCAGGDDAYFVNAGDSGATLDLGVFDGVGGWARRGHDPGVFSRGFAKAVAANITAQRTEQAISLRRLQREGGASPRFEKGVNLQEALEYATTNAALAGTQGTCTACVVRMDTMKSLVMQAFVAETKILFVSFSFLTI